MIKFLVGFLVEVILAQATESVDQEYHIYDDHHSHDGHECIHDYIQQKADEVCSFRDGLMMLFFVLSFGGLRMQVYD